MYLLSDIHGESAALYRWIFHSDEKYCIQLGDFGFIFSDKESLVEENVLDMLQLDLVETDKILFTILGNHECWPRYMKMKTVEVFGAKCWEVRPRIFVIQKGEVLRIEDKTFLCIGGANSHDVEWRLQYKKTYGIDIWWPEEQIEVEDIDNALHNCPDKKVDYVLTHTPPGDVTYKIFNSTYLSESELQLDKIYCNFDFIHWYCGHLHLHDESSYFGKNCTVLSIDEGVTI